MAPKYSEAVDKRIVVKDTMTVKEFYQTAKKQQI